TGRQVHRDDAQATQADLEIAAFFVELANAEAADDGVGFVARVDCNAAITLSNSVLVIAMVSIRGEAGIVELMVLRPGFLDAHDIRHLGGEPVEKPLARSGAYAVYIDGNYTEQFVVPEFGDPADVCMLRQPSQKKSRGRHPPTV